ncbi:MAG: chemotaxis protein CheD [Halothiobacillaceae bacterium]|nr:MAG: chemotaxis protein CheD [Halothiobacillaceae bacterium]
MDALQPWVPPGTAELPPTLPGYERVERYVDAVTGRPMARLKPGEIYVSREDEWLSTTVGSCVAVCLRDARGRVGGMNHVMLPGAPPAGDGQPGRYAGFAMPALIRALRRQAPSGMAIEARIYGGASAMAASHAGERNLEVVRHALQQAGIARVDEDVGGDVVRRVMFHPHSGQVVLKVQAMRQE